MGKDQQDLVGLQHQMEALLLVEEDVLLGVNRKSSSSIQRFVRLYPTCWMFVTPFVSLFLLSTQPLRALTKPLGL
jgi:hypothetical protein